MLGEVSKRGRASPSRAWGVSKTSGEVDGEMLDSLVCVEIKVNMGYFTIYSSYKVLPTPRSRAGMAVGPDWKLYLHTTEAAFSGQYVLVA